MGVTHMVFGGTLLVVFGVNLLTFPGSESSSIFDRITETEPATAVKKVFGQFLPQRDQPQPEQTKPDQQSTTTTAEAASGPGGFLNRVIGHFIPNHESDSKPGQKPSTTPTPSTTSTTTTTTAPRTSAAPKSSSKHEGEKTTTEEGGSATLPPFVNTCYLVKNDTGIFKSVNISRAEAGNDTYLDYEEYCSGDDVDTRISAGALASLAGKNMTTEEIEVTTVPPIDENCYLQKNDSGVINTIYMSRTEAGNEAYPDYEEICDDEAEFPVAFAISPGALASLAGRR